MWPSNVGKPRAAYRETVTSKAEASSSFIRQVGGRGHYGVVTVRVEPLPLGKVAGDTAFENRVSGELLDQKYADAVEAGVRDAAASGPRGGYPVVGWKAVLIDANQQSPDASELAFESAARIAFDEALQAAAPRPCWSRS